MNLEDGRPGAGVEGVLGFYVDVALSSELVQGLVHVSEPVGIIYDYQYSGQQPDITQ